MRYLKPWLVELIWFAATAILVVLVLLPIRQMIYGFPFERANILFIIGFVTLIRWFLFLSSTPFNRTHWVKIILGMGSIWLGIYALRQFSFFQTFIDEKGIESITQHLSNEDQVAMSKYIISEYIFFAVGTIIVCIMMPFRMLISVWRTYNLNKV